MKHGGEIYTVQGLLKYSWSDTCWERGIWRTDIFGSVRNAGEFRGSPYH